jgi:protein TonB
MLRNSSALLLSFLIHAAIALGVIFLYILYVEHVKDKEEVCKPICLSLSQVKKVCPSPPPPKPLPKKPPPPKVEPPKPIKKKMVKKKVIKKVAKPKKKPPKKVIIPKKVATPVVPVVVQAPVVVSKVVEPVQAQAVVPQPIQSVEEKYLKEHLQVIARLLKKYLYYPKRARKRRIEGKVHVEFMLLKNGQIKDIRVIKGSKDILNRAAVTTIEKLSGKVPKPPESITIEIPIVFRLK